MEKSICTIETWEDFKREIKKQFYPEDVAYLARKNMRRLKHTGSIRDYVKEFSSLMLETPHVFPSQVSHVLRVELPLNLPLKVLPRLYGANVFLHIGKPLTLP